MQVSDSSFFPQRVDESYDAAGEDPSQATEEIDLSHFASEGKPTTKLNPLSYFLFYILYYHVFNIHVLLHSGWCYCSCIRTKIHLLSPFRGIRARMT